MRLVRVLLERVRQEVEQVENAAVLLLAVRIGKARLIDNKVIKAEGEKRRGGRDAVSI